MVLVLSAKPSCIRAEIKMGPTLSAASSVAKVSPKGPPSLCRSTVKVTNFFLSLALLGRAGGRGLCLVEVEVELRGRSISVSELYL